MSGALQQPRLRDRFVARTLPLVPRRLVRRFSAPYIAGSTLDDAIARVRELSSAGMSVTVDVLGESARRKHDTDLTTRQYLQLLDALSLLGENDLVNVSVKLTAFGLGFDRELAEHQLLQIVERAAEHGGFVRIDMEDSPYTDDTFAIFEAIRERGFANVGVVIQAYLKRSLDDARRMAEMGVPVRVVKGIYLEPARLAWQDADRIRESFVDISRVLLEAGAPTALATHDEELIGSLLGVVDELGCGPDDYEFQMLLGVTEPLRGRLLAAGHRMRVYVPFGERWYEYSLRRLRENPRVAGYVAADVLRSLVPGRRDRSATAAATMDDVAALPG